VTDNPYDYDTGPFRHYSSSERTGQNLANSGHFARRHLGDCDFRVMNVVDECYFRNPSKGNRCECTQEDIRCCTRIDFDEQYCLECKMFCLKLIKPEVRTMDIKTWVKAHAKFVTAITGALVTILAMFLAPDQVAAVTALLTALGVYQVPNKPSN